MTKRVDGFAPGGWGRNIEARAGRTPQKEPVPTRVMADRRCVELTHPVQKMIVSSDTSSRRTWHACLAKRAPPSRSAPGLVSRHRAAPAPAGLQTGIESRLHTRHTLSTAVRLLDSPSFVAWEKGAASQTCTEVDQYGNESERILDRIQGLEDYPCLYLQPKSRVDSMQRVASMSPLRRARSSATLLWQPRPFWHPPQRNVERGQASGQGSVATGSRSEPELTSATSGSVALGSAGTPAEPAASRDSSRDVSRGGGGGGGSGWTTSVPAQSTPARSEPTRSPQHRAAPLRPSSSVPPGGSGVEHTLSESPPEPSSFRVGDAVLIASKEWGYEGFYCPGRIVRALHRDVYGVEFPEIKVATCPHKLPIQQPCRCPCEVDRVESRLVYPAEIPEYDAALFVLALAPGMPVQYRHRGCAGWWDLTVDKIVGVLSSPHAKIHMQTATFGSNNYTCLVRDAAHALRPGLKLVERACGRGWDFASDLAHKWAVEPPPAETLDEAQDQDGELSGEGQQTTPLPIRLELHDAAA